MPTRVHSTRAFARDRAMGWRPWLLFRPCGISPLRRFTPRLGSRPVASRYRTWGSPGFCRADRRRPKTTRTGSTFPPALDPPKVYSSSAAVPHRWGLLPKTVRSKATLLPLDSTSPRRRLRLPLLVSRIDRTKTMESGREFPPSRNPECETTSQRTARHHTPCWHRTDRDRDPSLRRRVAPGCW